MRYAVKIAKIYKLHPEQVTCCFGFESVAGTLNESYMVLLREKVIEPIESIDQERKQDYWERSKKYSDDRTQRMFISRGIYLLDMLTK